VVPAWGRVENHSNPSLKFFQHRRLTAQIISSPSFTIHAPARRMGFTAEKLSMPQPDQHIEIKKLMGDKSPKSNQKKSSQKQAKVSSADQKKQQAASAKAAASSKKK
jgi:predicted alpha/beta superfamily hydrolase